MTKLSHYYQALFLLGSLLATPLYAAEQKSQEADDDTKQVTAQHTSTKSWYRYEDLTFIDQEKDKVDKKELKAGLIHFFQQIKAKEQRVVYFFIGGIGASHRPPLWALQGNKFPSAIVEDDSHSDDSDSALFDNPDKEKKSLLLPNKNGFAVGYPQKGQTNHAFISYPDPKQPKYSGIAFADTEAFFSQREATSTEKCLAAISFFYALKVNRVGGFVLVVSASELDHLILMKAYGLKRISHILQTYFSKAVSNNTIQKSLLVMITQVTSKHDKAKAIHKFRQLIQLFYQEYYAEIENEDLFNKGIKAISPLTKKKLEEKRQKQHETLYLKHFFDMLLAHDVPKDNIGDIHNFTLDKQRFCFSLSWQEKCIQKILDKRLTSLKPLPASDLGTFDNPLSQYMKASMRCFSIQLNRAIQPLLALKRKIDTIETKISGITDKQVIDQTIEALEDGIEAWCDAHSIMRKSNNLEVVFSGAHYQRLPFGREVDDGHIDKCKAHKLWKLLVYGGEEPIYKIWATYGPNAALSEGYPFLHGGGGPTDKFDFISKHFKITEKVDNNGMVIWEAIAKNGKGVIKKDGWHLYHATEGKHKAQCDIIFYALKRARIASKEMIIADAVHTKSLVDQIVDYETNKHNYNTLESTRKKETKKWEDQRRMQIKAWESTAHMLQFFANNILREGADKRLIQKHLKNFGAATQLEAFLPALEIKGNNQKNKPNKEEEKASVLDLAYDQLDADEHQLNASQSADDEVFDID